jgi:hypothetical protein
MKIRSAYLSALCVLFFACTISLLLKTTVQASGTEERAINVSSGELVYVPVYPSIYYMGQKKSLDLTVTLSIHNISPDISITLDSVEYYNQEGKLIKKILEKPRVLNPLETTSFVVNEKKEPGGVGANFMVTWRASKQVNPPIIQAVMITTTVSQGISFITDGVPVKTAAP